MEYDDYSTDNFSTYSEDERYARHLEDIQRKKLENEESRREKYAQLAAEQEHRIFTLQGLSILKFTYMKIKFSFEPSLLYKRISKKLIFYCSLKYLEKCNKWTISREPMPLKPLYSKVTSGSVHISDNFPEIGEIIIKIYERLKKRSEREVRYRRKRYEKYQAGILSYMDIDSTDEELYFSENERKALFEKRQAVLKRMLPPSPTKFRLLRKRATKLKYKI